MDNRYNRHNRRKYSLMSLKIVLQYSSKQSVYKGGCKYA